MNCKDEMFYENGSTDYFVYILHPCNANSNTEWTILLMAWIWNTRVIYLLGNFMLMYQWLCTVSVSCMLEFELYIYIWGHYYCDVYKGAIITFHNAVCPGIVSPSPLYLPSSDWTLYSSSSLTESRRRGGGGRWWRDRHGGSEAGASPRLLLTDPWFKPVVLSLEHFGK